MTIDVLKTLRNDSKCNSNPLTVPGRRTNSSVRRSLFGKVDHTKSMSFLKKELNAIAESEKKRWNFDFVNETPLISDEYEWTAVQPGEDIPKAYALDGFPYLRDHIDNTLEVTITKTKLKQTSLDGYIYKRKRSSSPMISTKGSSSYDMDVTQRTNAISDSQQSTSCFYLEPSSKKQCVTPSKNPTPPSSQ